MKNKLKLTEYILLSGSFLTCAKGAFSQVEYIDFEPDLLITDNNYAEIDVDNDGVFDFRFIRAEGDITTWSFDTFHFSEIWIAPNVTKGHSIAAAFVQIGSNASSSFYQEFVYAKPVNYPVNVVMSFQNDDYQVIGYRTNRYGSDWDHGFWWDFEDDRYVCFRLKNAENEYNYGWIRCLFHSDDVTITIKDLGYEQQNNKAILTGSSESYTDIQTPFQQSNLLLTFQNNVLKIDDVRKNFNPYLLTIYALNGAVISQEKVSVEHFEKYIELPVGLYLLKIQQGNANYCYKITNLN